MKTSVPGLLLDSGPNGMSRFRVQTELASAELFLHGAFGSVAAGGSPTGVVAEW